MVLSKLLLYIPLSPSSFPPIPEENLSELLNLKMRSSCLSKPALLSSQSQNSLPEPSLVQLRDMNDHSQNTECDD